MLPILFLREKTFYNTINRREKHILLPCKSVILITVDYLLVTARD